MGQTASHPPTHLDTRARSRGTSPAPPEPRKPTHGPRKKSLELPDLTTKLALSPRPPAAPIPIRGQPDRDREPIHRLNNTNESLLDVRRSSPVAMNDVLAPTYHPPHPSPSHRRGGYHAPPSSLVARPTPPTPLPLHASPPNKRRPKKPTGEHIYSTIPLGVNKGKGRAVDAPTPSTTLVPTRISWRGPGVRVEIAGTFDDWQGRRPLVWDPSIRAHVTTIDLRPGTYRLKFIVDDQWKCANDLPTAVDDAGNLVNYIEVTEDAREVLGWEKGLTSAPGTSIAPRLASPLIRHPEDQPQWTSEIPPQLIQAAQLEEQYLSRRGEPDAPPPPLIPHPPALPRHLEKVILNARATGNAASASGVGPGKTTVASMGGVGCAGGADDNSVLPVPNHVVLNHLGTSAIKGGVLAVGTTTRYHRKYITTIYYKPVS